MKDIAVWAVIVLALSLLVFGKMFILLPLMFIMGYLVRKYQ